MVAVWSLCLYRLSLAIGQKAAFLCLFAQRFITTSLFWANLLFSSTLYPRPSHQKVRNAFRMRLLKYSWAKGLLQNTTCPNSLGRAFFQFKRWASSLLRSLICPKPVLRKKCLGKDWLFKAHLPNDENQIISLTSLLFHPSMRLRQIPEQ